MKGSQASKNKEQAICHMTKLKKKSLDGIQVKSSVMSEWFYTGAVSVTSV